MQGSNLRCSASGDRGPRPLLQSTGNRRAPARGPGSSKLRSWSERRVQGARAPLRPAWASAEQAITGSLRPAAVYGSTRSLAPATSAFRSRLLVEVIDCVWFIRFRWTCSCLSPTLRPVRSAPPSRSPFVVEGPWSPARRSVAAGLSLSGGASCASSFASQVGHHLWSVSGWGTKKGGHLGRPRWSGRMSRHGLAAGTPSEVLGRTALAVERVVPSCLFASVEHLRRTKVPRGSPVCNRGRAGECALACIRALGDFGAFALVSRAHTEASRASGCSV